jgi:hypothetical protein
MKTFPFSSGAQLQVGSVSRISYQHIFVSLSRGLGATPSMCLIPALDTHGLLPEAT